MYVSTTPDSLSRNASAPGHHFPTQADDLPRFAYDDEAGQSVIGSHGHWGTCASGQVSERHLSDQEQPFDTHSGDNKGETRGKGHAGSGQRPEPYRTAVGQADSKE